MQMENRVTLDSHDILLALKIRAFEETLLDVYGSGKIRGTVHTSIGQELLPVVLKKFIDVSQDFVFGTHRSHALYLALSNDFFGLCSEILGKESGTSLGLGGSQHLNFDRFFSNGIQAGLVPIAFGTVLDPSAKNDKKSSGTSKTMSVCFVGDGTLGEGLFFEALNVGKVYGCKTLIIIEDNLISQSTKTSLVHSSAIQEKVTGFGIDCRLVDSNEIEKLIKAISQAVHDVRTGNVPICLVVQSNRIGPHSKGDDNRSATEIVNLKEKDFLGRLLREEKSYLDLFDELKLEIKELFESVQYQPEAKAVFIDVAKEWRMKNKSLEKVHETSDSVRISYRESIRESIDEILSTFPESIFIGEDIEYKHCEEFNPYMGAFGVSGNLSEKHKGRVVNFPISESTLIGVAIGRAIAGKFTIVEIMFSDFLTLIIDQIRQQASKIPTMYGKFIPLKFLVRAATGGRKGYGPTHSQNFEEYFLGTPNLIVHVLNILSDGRDPVYLMESNLPVISFEDKDLYNEKPGYQIPVPYKIILSTSQGDVLVSTANQSTDILVISYGRPVEWIIDAAAKLARTHEFFFDIIAISIVSPLNIRDLLKFQEKNYSKILLIEDLLQSNGLSSLLVEEFSHLNYPFIFRRLGTQGDIGASLHAENFVRVSPEKILNFLLKESSINEI